MDASTAVLCLSPPGSETVAFEGALDDASGVEVTVRPIDDIPADPSTTFDYAVVPTSVLDTGDPDELFTASLPVVVSDGGQVSIGETVDRVTRRAAAGQETDPVAARATTPDGESRASALADAAAEYTDEETFDPTLLKQAIDAAHTPLTLSDPRQPDNPLVYVNEAFERVTGYDAEQCVGRNCRFLQGPRTETETLDRLREGIAAEEPVTVELNNYTADGELFRNRLTVTPIYDGDGELVHFLGSQEDVTEEWRAHRDAELVRTLVNEANDIVLVAEADTGEIVDANETACEALGYDYATLTAEHVSALAFESRERADYHGSVDIDETVPGTDTADRTLVRADGTRFPAEVTTRETQFDDHTYRLYVARDVTERVRRERRREELSDAIQHLHETTTPEAVSTTVVEATRRALDLTVAGVWFHDERAETLEPVAVDREETTGRDETGATDAEVDDGDSERDRTETPASTAYPVDGESPQARAFRAGEATAGDSPAGVETGSPVESTVCLPLGDHGVLVLGVGPAGRLTDGDVRLAELFAGNVRAALDRLSSERRVREQRDDLQVLNRMMRHDIGNDLQASLAFANAIEEQTEGEPAELASRIARNTHDAIDVTESARELSRTVLDPEQSVAPAPFAATVRDHVETIRATAPEATVEIDGHLPEVAVLVDDMFGSAVRNLLTNAVSHNDTEEPRVTVSATRSDDGERVTLRVADDGPGVDPDHRETIFGRGEKGLGSDGTGIGLYLVQTFVDTVDGDVWVTDNDPRGAVFGLELPVATEE
ncbi:PAS domain-containing protein [Halobaculum sp. MBLA0147]|uniref:PAS domain-containing protein n=1 Tax=Halobaculum sp. MBLA0147 TaxID=3079934 RepID=UPI003525A059